MNTIIGGVIGLVILLLGMTMSNALGVLLGFIAGVLIRLALITLQWESLYTLGITGFVLCPGLIESNPFVLIGMLVGSFALEPISNGMKYILTGIDSLVHGERIELEHVCTDGRVPTHIYAFYGILITLLLGVILALGLESTFAFIKPVAFIISGCVTVGMWVYRCYELSQESNKNNVMKLILGMGLSLGITLMSVATYAGSGLSVYSVILPLVLMGLPIGKKVKLKKEVLPDMLSDDTPVHNDNFTTCVLGGLMTSVLISTSQRQVAKRLTNNPFDQYGIEAVGTYIQFGLFWLLNWGKSGETSVMKVISSYQSLDLMAILFVLLLLCCVLVYTLCFTREVMSLLVSNSKGRNKHIKTIGEVVCIALCILLAISSPNPALGLFMCGACLLANVLMSKNMIPSESMMGALLLPYIAFIR
jgi:hypothetical protein